MRSRAAVAELVKPVGDVALEPYAHEIVGLRRWRDAERAPQCRLETQQRLLCQPNKRNELASRLGRKLSDCGLEAPPLLALECRKVESIWTAQDRTLQGRLLDVRAPSADTEILGHCLLVATAPPRHRGDRERVFCPKRLEHGAIVARWRACAKGLRS